MSVIRIKKKRTPYVTLDTTALNDARLSFRAKGLHAYLCSKPDDWQIYIAQLEHEAKEGRDAIRKAMEELETHGYLTREKQRDSRGRLLGWATTVYETPELAQAAGGADDGEAIGLDEPTTDSPKSDSPKSDSPKSDSPKSENPLLLNNDLTQILNLEKIEETQTAHACVKGLVPAKPSKAKTKLPTDYSPGFLRWWDAYPADRRDSKPACFAFWRDHDLEARTDELVAKIERLILATWSHIAERRFIKTTLPYLNAGRYEDELVLLTTVAHRAPGRFFKPEM